MAAGYLEDLPLRRGAITGAVAFVIGILVTFPLLLVAPPPLSTEAARIPIAMGSFSYLIFHGWVVAFGGPSNLMVFTGIPVVILLGAGYSVATATSESPRRGVARGATIASGYLVLVLLSIGFVLWRQPSLAAVVAEPAQFVILIPISAFAFAGIAFPLIFGGLGGALAERRGY